MVVHDLHVASTRRSPTETDSKLIIDSDAALPSAIALQPLEPIAWWNAQVAELPGDLQLPQLAPRNGLDGSEFPDPSAVR